MVEVVSAVRCLPEQHEARIADTFDEGTMVALGIGEGVSD
jgi:hypothetical protein